MRYRAVASVAEKELPLVKREFWIFLEKPAEMRSFLRIPWSLCHGCVLVGEVLPERFLELRVPGIRNAN